MRIGFIGMGLMGIPMSLRLSKAGLTEAGWTTCVWNRSKNNYPALEEMGLAVCEHLPELIANSDVLMLCVTNTDAVREVVFGEHGIAKHGRAGQIVVDFSSIDPVATRDMAQRLYQQTSIRWIDSPVSGGVAGAEQGTLAIMAGGDADVIDQIRPLLAPLSQRVTRMGDVGSGQVTKICNQMLVSCNVLVMAEVMALAESAGVNATDIPGALQGGFADSLPLQLTGPKMAKRDYDEIKWHVRTLLKDLDMANTLAQQLQSAVPMVGLGAELMRQHSGRGFSDQDPATLIELYSVKKGEIQAAVKADNND
ncbi:MAG: NAD(P)-dependent oxidoreductase [Oleibacter sp.]|nr:NAD(P)-dependent oxidoreductase [Thalassolituus sp.]